MPPTGKLIVSYGGHPGDGYSSDAAVPIDVVGEGFAVRQETLRPNSPLTLELEPGAYLVRAFLPSGQTLMAQGRVESGQTNAVALAQRKGSPRESLVWAYRLRHPTAFAASTVLDEETLTRSGWDDVRLGCELWQRPAGHPGEGWRPADAAIAGITKVDESVRQQDPDALASVKLRLPVLAPAPPPSDQRLDQFWLRVTGAGLSRFVAVPTPAFAWGEVVRVLVARDARDLPAPDVPSDPLTVVVQSGNPSATQLVGYLATGSLQLARRVGEDVLRNAEFMLRDKCDDPSSAAIAGYYLLKAGQLHRLHDWTSNLADWFPWMADGAVIHAWHLLRQDKAAGAAARGRLLLAERRGLPFFTEGLRLLYDGLDYFAHRAPDDRDVYDARSRVQPYARAANWRSATTSFYAGSPAEPELPSGFRV